MAEDREQLHARDRVVQQMGRSGLTEENTTRGTVRNVSSRQEDFLLDGGGQPEQAHDRSRNRVYHQPADAAPPRAAPDTGIPPDTAPSPPAAATEPDAPEDTAGMPGEFAGFAGRMAQISGGNGEKDLNGDGEHADDTPRKLKEETAKGEHGNRPPRYGEEEPEGEESNGEGTEKRGEKKQGPGKQAPPGRLKEDGKGSLKFREEKNRGKQDRPPKRGKRQADGAEEGENPEQEPGKKTTEREEGEGEGHGEGSRGRLKFEDDGKRDSLPGRTGRMTARKTLERFADEQEEEMDSGARSAYQAGRGTLRGTGYINAKSRLRKTRTGEGHGREESGRLRERGENRQKGTVRDGETGNRESRDKNTERARLETGSRYFKEAEKKNPKKEYQRRANRQKSMEAAQHAQKGSESVATAKTAAVKAAAAIKGSILPAAAILLLFPPILFAAGYLLSSIAHMGAAGIGAIYGGLYQTTYSDITDCEAYYRELETDLEELVAGMEDGSEHPEYADCYEFIYDLGHVGHRAVELASYLAARHTDFTLETCRGELDSLFGEMYTLEVETREEPRERNRTDAAGNTIYGADGNPEKETFQAKICYVTLTVKPWDETVESRMTPGETERYRVYLLSQGGQQVYGNPLLEGWQDKISSPFGYRIHPTTKEKTLHAGIDIAVPEGTPLFSSTDGTVATARYSDTAGNYIEITTESGYTVRYLHLDSIGVSAGDTVEKGALIGATGNTGRSTGPHLHLEVRTPDGNPIDPTFIVANGEGKTETPGE